MLSRSVLIAAATLVALPCTAGASTVTATVSCVAGGRTCDTRIGFSGDPGEANNVTLATTSSVAYRFRDEGAPIQFGPTSDGCTRVDEREVVCQPFGGPSGGDTTVSAGLGDGDDRIVASSPVVVDGGPGADHLEGVTADYINRTAPVVVDLAARSGGEAGEGDELVNVHGVLGGRGDDVLRGTDAVDTLEGGPGNDMIEGRGGNDRLSGDGGADTIDGGAGNDQIPAQDSDGDAITCGAGKDEVGDSLGFTSLYVDPEDMLARDCELARLPSINDVVPRPKVSNGKLVIRVPGTSCRCRGELAVRTTGGRTLAGGRTTLAKHRLVVPLTRSGRRLFAKRGPHTVRVVWRADGERAGFTTTVG